MNTSCPIVLLTVLVGLTCALPPFEIRSAGSQKSEAAVDWIRHLQKDKCEYHILFLFVIVLGLKHIYLLE